MGIFGNRMGIGTSGTNSRFYYAKGTCYEPDTFPPLPPRVLLRLPLFFSFLFSFTLFSSFLFFFVPLVPIMSFPSSSYFFTAVRCGSCQKLVKRYMHSHTKEGRGREDHVKESVAWGQMVEIGRRVRAG